MDGSTLTRPARNDRLVETMTTADGLRLTAYGPDEYEIRVTEGAIPVLGRLERTG